MLSAILFYRQGFIERNIEGVKIVDKDMRLISIVEINENIPYVK